MNGLIRYTAAALLLAAGMPAADGPAKLSPSAEVVLEWLRFGNERHAQGKSVHWHQSPERRLEVAREQRPHAIVLTCSDARVPPELLFDQGIGDLYVVRVAGNITGPREVASIEYAAERLGVPVVVVLAHQRCHVAEAAVEGKEEALAAAVARAKFMSGDPADQAAQVYADSVAEKLRVSEPALARLVRMGKLKITSAYYNLDRGEVSWR